MAKLAAASLVTASAGLGAFYAWNVGSTHGVILGSLFVFFAIGLELAKPLAVMTALRALGSWHLARGALLSVLAVVAVAYSLSAELALMAGTRSDVIASRQAALDRSSGAAADLQQAVEVREAAKLELASLAPARPVAEVVAEIDALLLLPGADGCTEINGRVTREVCPKVAALRIERARAERRADLLSVLAKPLPKAAATQGAVHVLEADPGASALAAFLAALGIPVSAYALSHWLALVPVVALELGSALGGILVQAVPRSANGAFARPASSEARIEVAWNTSPEKTGKAVPSQVGTAVSAGQAIPLPALEQASRGSVPACPAAATKDDDEDQRPNHGARLGTALLDHLKQQGGKVTGGQRGLAKLLDASTTELNRTIHRLAAAGAVLVTADRLTGTTLELAAA